MVAGSTLAPRRPARLRSSPWTGPTSSNCSNTVRYRGALHPGIVVGMARRTPQVIDYRSLVLALPASYDAAIESAMENAAELGHSEEADDDGAAFWHQVHGEVTA